MSRGEVWISDSEKAMMNLAQLLSNSIRDHALVSAKGPVRVRHGVADPTAQFSVVFEDQGVLVTVTPAIVSTVPR